MLVCTLVSWVSYIRARKTGNRGDAERCEIDKQRVHVILCDNVRNMNKAMEDMAVLSVGCIAHTSAGCTRGSAVTVQCHRLTCLRKEGGRSMLQLYMQNKSHMKVYTFFNKIKKKKKLLGRG